jgi:uncharacterized protein
MEYPMFDKKEGNNMISKVDRKRIFIFVAVTYGITIALAVVIFFNGGLFHNRTHLVSILMVATMFAPAIGNIATRLITHEGWKNTYLRPNLRRGWPFYLAAWTLPIAAIIVGGAIYYLLYPGRLDLSMQWARQSGFIISTDPWWSVATQEILFNLRTAPLIIWLMLGEEFGWRAYLLPKLMPLGSRKAVLLAGAIWGVFHWPLIFMGYEYRFGYWGAPVVGPLLFVFVTTFGDNAFFSWVTIRTGSVWPASLAHAVSNLSTVLPLFILRGEPDLLIGPMSIGIVGFLGYALLALPIFLHPGALAQPVPPPIDTTLSSNPAAAEVAAGQAELGAFS